MAAKKSWPSLQENVPTKCCQMCFACSLLTVFCKLFDAQNAAFTNGWLPVKRLFCLEQFPWAQILCFRYSLNKFFLQEKLKKSDLSQRLSNLQNFNSWMKKSKWINSKWCIQSKKKIMRLACWVFLNLLSTCQKRAFSVEIFCQCSS